MSKELIKLSINNKKYEVMANPMDSLLDLLREELNLKGTKKGCGEGECGACSIIMNGDLTLACLTPVIKADGANITTIEGLEKDGEPSYIQKSFMNKGAVQCGFCTPGFVMATHHYIENGGVNDKMKIKHALSGNFCRCTGYTKIIDAVEDAIDIKNGKKK